MKFGQRVGFTHKLERKLRREPYEVGGLTFHRTWKEWKRIVCPTASGIFIGERTLSNGTVAFETDWGWIYKHDHSFRVALVAPNSRENPVYVPLTCIRSRED